MKKLFSLIALVLLLFPSCDKNNNEVATEKSTTVVKVYLHDQPAAYQQVNVDIQQVLIKGYGNNDEIDMADNAGVYNLLDYQNGLDTLLGEITIDYDSISQIRLVLGPDNSVMVDSVLYPMDTPSAQQSGLKILINGAVNYVDTLVISLDFDANESVHQLGNGSYQLHPVIHQD